MFKLEDFPLDIIRTFIVMPFFVLFIIMFRKSMQMFFESSDSESHIVCGILFSSFNQLFVLLSQFMKIPFSLLWVGQNSPSLAVFFMFFAFYMFFMFAKIVHQFVNLFRNFTGAFFFTSFAKFIVYSLVSFDFTANFVDLIFFMPFSFMMFFFGTLFVMTAIAINGEFFQDMSVFFNLSGYATSCIFISRFTQFFEFAL